MANFTTRYGLPAYYILNKKDVLSIYLSWCNAKRLRGHSRDVALPSNSEPVSKIRLKV